jgi:hypothetical protein
MYNGVKATYVNGYFFVRAVLTEYPMENVSTNSAQDNERIQRYNALEESIRQSVRSLMLTRDEIFENNADNTSESDEGSDDGVDAPTIHHAQMMKAINYAPYSSANNTTSSSTNTESLNGRPRSKSDTSVPRSVSVPNTRSPQTLRHILELNNKVNPLAQCHHRRGRTSKRKFKQRMRIIISDGGATSSMFTDRSLFTHYRECKNTYVKMAEGTMCEVKGIGNVGKLTDVLHVEGLVFDLVSESWCDKQGMQGHWGGGVRYVEDTDGSIFYTAYLEEGLYIVNPVLLGIEDSKYADQEDFCLASKAEVSNTLHQRLCHINEKRTENGIASGHIPWLHDSSPTNLKKCSDPCVVCQLAKSQRRQFNKPLHPVYVPGQHTYLDLYGPLECESLIDGSLYCAGFIDVYSSHL